MLGQFARFAMIRYLKILLLAGFVATIATSCDGDQGPRLTLAEQEGDSEPMLFAKNHFKVLCVSCHGTTGRGDGPGAKGFPTPPRSFGERIWQDQTSDERIIKVILEGGLAVGLNQLMAPNYEPRVEEDPEVMDALVQIIRSFGR